MIVSPNKPYRACRWLLALEERLKRNGLPLTREGAMQLRGTDWRNAMPRTSRYVVQWASVNGYRYSVQTRGGGYYAIPILCKNVNDVARVINSTIH